MTVTRSEGLTMGIGRVPPGEALRTHRHLPPEIYLLLEGTGSVEIGPDARPIEAGSAVFIPGDAPPLLGEHEAVGFAVRLRLCRGFVRRGRVHLRGIT